tara:strand:+ start:105 stop:575 length:471 start_codon:yes stop_codon:yes gene_type:complete
MAITITPDEATGLTDITRPNFAMNQTVTASSDDGSDTITNVTASVAGSQPDLVITSGTTSVNIGGTLTDPFNDQFTYVEKGTDASLYPKTPVTVTKISNMPPDKLLYDLNQDNTTPYTETFTITVTADTGTTTFTLELKINNAYEGIRSFISNYYT